MLIPFLGSGKKPHLFDPWIFKLFFWGGLHNKGDVASRTESQKLNNFSNFKSAVCELCRINLQVIERDRDASKLGISN